jgi:hypothetical protein
LISFENLNPTERANAKEKEAGRITLAKTEQYARNERSIEIAKSLFQTLLSDAEIAKHTGLTLEQIEELRNELNQ